MYHDRGVHLRRRRNASVRRAYVWVVAAYAAALVAAVATVVVVDWRHPLAVALAADVAATLVIFAFSVAFGNSSFYDPYWSVAPAPIAIYWASQAQAAGVSGVRQALVIGFLALWGARLTYNWLRGWHGLGHEDWRYVRLQEQSGRAYWLVSFFGIHLFPTLIVFAACVPAYAAIAVGTRPLGLLDAVAVAVTAGAIWIEARADRELHEFRAGRPAPESVLASGVWSWSRHPNYFGEMSFWWGLFLFGLAAVPSWWWAGIGALSITLMFRFISLPMMEERMRERRPGYSAYAARTSLVVPLPPREHA